MNTTPDPGWYPDPTVPNTQRYWDGSTWTEHVAPLAPAGPTDPSGPAVPAGSAGPQLPYGSPTPTRQLNWFLQHKIASGLLAFLVIAIIASALSGGDDPVDNASGTPTDKASASPSKKTPAGKETEQTKEATPEAQPEPEKYGDGTYRVGDDMPEGIYRSSEESDLCYWATLKGFSGELNDIVRNGNSSPAIVELTKSMKGFESQGCGDWVDVAATFPDKPATSFGDGAYVVGKHIKPGQYRASAKASDLCYWARISTFGGGGIDGIITNGNSPTVIEIRSSDYGFESYGCGDWE